MTANQVLGIDIGGSGIKGALIDQTTGVATTDRFRLPTPQPATPDEVCNVVEAVVEHFGWLGPVGCTYPGVIKQGVVHTAANVDKRWIGVNIYSLLSQRIKGPVTVLNDADAAGLAEAYFGAAKGRQGVVLLLTLGTGIGSALIVDGRLVPNTELGHLEIGGHEAEHIASDKVREKGKLGWKSWAKRLNQVLEVYEALLWPDLFVIGGGVSKKHELFLPLLTVRTPVVPAALRNMAGIIGAALAAAHAVEQG
jgi:polyphosphate glucokinase